MRRSYIYIHRDTEIQREVVTKTNTRVHHLEICYFLIFFFRILVLSMWSFLCKEVIHIYIETEIQTETDKHTSASLGNVLFSELFGFTFFDVVISL